MLFDYVYRELWFCHVRTCMHSLCTRVVHSRNVMQEYRIKRRLILNAPIATKVVCFSRKKPLWQTVDRDQTAPIGAVCSGSKLFASILNSSVMLGNCLQQTTSADGIFRCIFFLRFKVSVNSLHVG